MSYVIVFGLGILAHRYWRQVNWWAHWTYHRIAGHHK